LDRGILGILMNPLARLSDIAQRTWSGFVWRESGISAGLASGVKLWLRSRAEWEVFLEIFVQSEYDEAIRLALDNANGRSARIVDLGANVGFFALRCLDLSRRANALVPFEILAVEGVDRVYSELVRRCGANDFSPGRASLYHGLVGKTTGQGFIYDTGYSCGNSVVPDGGKRSKLAFRGAHAVRAEYLDLQKAIAWDGPIDLIKCDIEGSELEFLQNYPTLIQRARYLAIEIHPLVCSIEKCRDQINHLGFRIRRTVRDGPGAVHYLAEQA
jgi:FkbM family methyltransferase